MKRGIVAVDLFCGAGGLTRGLLDSGINVLKGYDFDGKAAETYERNNRGAQFFNVDITSLKGKDLTEGIDTENNFFLLAGCAPCQPFSIINQKSIAKDDRKNLILKFAKLITETCPDFILMENVPGLANGKGKRIFNKFLKTLEREGYKYSFNVLNTKDYGVPQKRRRLVLLASKHSNVEIPKPTHGNSKNPLVTVRDAIGKYPSLQAGESNMNIPNHQARKLSELNLKRIKATKKNGGSRSDLPEELLLECHKKHKGHNDVYGRMLWDDVSPTLTCKCTSLSNGRFGHPTQNRAITVREAASIQTFPEDYIFYGNMCDATKWVGNAVPVRFSKVFGDYFMRTKKTILN